MEDKPQDPREVKVSDMNHIPCDSVQVIKFCPVDSTIFAAGCWDEHVRIYQIVQNGIQKALVQRFALNLGAPVLDLTWNPNGQSLFAATGDSSKNIIAISLSSNPPAPAQLGFHQGVTNIIMVNFMNIELMLTTGLNKRMYVWLNQNGWAPKLEIHLPKNPNGLDVDSGSGLVVIGLEMDVGIYKLEKLNSGDNQITTMSITLKSPINCLKIREKSKEDDHQSWKEGERTLVICGSDGRTLIGDLNLSSLKFSERILYRAHNKGSDLFSINSCGFSRISTYSMFTCGTDGSIYFWDLQNKNKLTTYIVPEGHPITSAEISPDQKYFAFSTGYDWSQGAWAAHKYQMRSQVYVHEMREKDHRK